MCATWVPQIIGAVPEIQHGESRVTTEGVYSPNVAMSIVPAIYSETIYPQCPNLPHDLARYSVEEIPVVFSDFSKKLTAILALHCYLRVVT